MSRRPRPRCPPDSVAALARLVAVRICLHLTSMTAAGRLLEDTALAGTSHHMDTESAARAATTTTTELDTTPLPAGRWTTTRPRRRALVGITRSPTAATTPLPRPRDRTDARRTIALRRPETFRLATARRRIPATEGTGGSMTVAHATGKCFFLCHDLLLVCVL